MVLDLALFLRKFIVYCIFWFVFTNFIAVAHVPFVIGQEMVYEKFTDIWRQYPGETDVLFKALVCPRNVEIFLHSKDIALAWDSFAKFVAFLLRKKLVSCGNLEEQCVAIFRQEWDRNTLTHMTNGFNALTKYYLRYGGSESEFTFLVGFLSEFCSDVDF